MTVTTRSRLGTHRRNSTPFIVKTNYVMTPEIAQALIATPAVSRALAEMLDKAEARKRALAGELHQEWAGGFAYAPQVLAGLPEERIEIREEADLLVQEGVTEKQTVN